jgi:hypothetical protein
LYSLPIITYRSGRLFNAIIVMQLISVSLHDLQSRMAASPTDWIQYPDESFTQDNATRYYGMRRRSSQTGS